MRKLRKIVRTSGIFMLILLALPIIAFKLGINKLLKSISKTNDDKIRSVDKFVKSLSGEASADIGTGGGCGCSSGTVPTGTVPTTSTGCGHDSNY